MKSIERGLAVFLAVLLAVTPLRVSAGEMPVLEKTRDYGSLPVETEDNGNGGNVVTEENVDSGNGESSGLNEAQEDRGQENAGLAETEGSGSQKDAGVGNQPVGMEAYTLPGSVPDEVNDAIQLPEALEKTPKEADLWSGAMDEVCFNTGSYVYRIGNASASGNMVWDGCFNEDGSYIINIPEENPFFPYEVQFTYDGKTENRWFMAPGDSVEVNGHTFYVSAYFDNTVMTQMSLNISGETVVVYPEEKEFMDGDGAELLSLLPLEERKLRVDFKSYTPAEMSRVSIGSIFAGNEQVRDTDKVVWRYADSVGYDYTVNESGDELDLSYGTSNSDALIWEMIVGAADQLATDNIRYTVQMDVTPSRHWLKPVVYMQDSEGNRKEILVSEYIYSDYSYNRVEEFHTQNLSLTRMLTVFVPEDEMGRETQAYVGLDFDSSIYGNSKCASLRVLRYDLEQMAYVDITDRVCGQDMTQAGAGEIVQLDADRSWTYLIQAYDAGGNCIGEVQVAIILKSNGSLSYTYADSMLDGKGRLVGRYSQEEAEGLDFYCKVALFDGYDADETYYLTLGYIRGGNSVPSAVTAAYAGQYSSIAEAVADGAENIKDVLFPVAGRTEKGYGTDYSQGVYFTVFVGEDGTPGQEVYHCCVRTVEEAILPSIYNGIIFSGLRGSDGADIPCYVVPLYYDSFGAGNFYTILVDEGADLGSLAPVFTAVSGAKVYTAGSSTPEASGISFHDFSQGAVQYTVLQEEGANITKNYWLQVVKAKEGMGRLYINSLDDAGSGTREVDGVVYSTREVMLDPYHNNRHDILLINTGTEAIPKLSAELESDVVELDDYWTLKGNYSLPGFTALVKPEEHGELPNFAQLRIKAKNGVEEGTEVSGTLTIKSGTTSLMVLTLTGIIGGPRIITEELPQSLKCTLWVPYGTFIQDNNKYDWNKVSYRLAGGSLPAGMEVKENGEIYGVPGETGEFTFTVCMANSTSSFQDDTKTYTLTVAGNTDENVEASTDPGYELIQRVPDFRAGAALEDSYTLVSVGAYGEFVDVYLDGRKLESGSDYVSESGSTRIMVRSQTLTPPGSAGTHTLGVEFRTKDTNLLKRAAQNYTVDYDVSGSGDGSGNNGTDDGGSGSGNNWDDSNGNTAGESGSSDGSDISDANGLAVSSAVRAVAIAVSTADTDAVIRYTVESGDTLWRIAEKFYGSGKYWQKVFEDNSAVISNPDRIYVGQIIVIYKAWADAYAMQANSAAGVGSGGSTYTVETGDTLWEIARKVYGKGWQWRQIYQANTDTVHKPGNIYAGQVLYIPKKE